MLKVLTRHKGPIVAGVFIVGCLLAGLTHPNPTPADIARLSRLAPEPPALTCADLPAITAELDQITNWSFRYGWIIFLGLVLGVYKLMEMLVVLMNGVEWLSRRVWSALRSRREGTAL